jgi:hypothetical protein
LPHSGTNVRNPQMTGFQNSSIVLILPFTQINFNNPTCSGFSRWWFSRWRMGRPGRMCRSIAHVRKAPNFFSMLEVLLHMHFSRGHVKDDLIVSLQETVRHLGRRSWFWIGTFVCHQCKRGTPRYRRTTCVHSCLSTPRRVSEGQRRHCWSAVKTHDVWLCPIYIHLFYTRNIQLESPSVYRYVFATSRSATRSSNTDVDPGLSATSVRSIPALALTKKMLLHRTRKKMNS